MLVQTLPAVSLRSVNRLPASGTLMRASNYLICWALWSIRRALFRGESSFLPALREAADGAAVVPFLAGRARGCVLKGTSDRLEGRLGLEIGVERQWSRGGLVGPPFRLVGLSSDDPAMPVRQAPGHDHLYRRFVESRVQEPPVDVSHQTVSDCHVGRRVLVGDVKLGDLDRQAEGTTGGEEPPPPPGRNVGEKPPQQRCRKGRAADRRQMGLDADCVDRRAGSSHPFEQAQQRDAAGLMLGRIELYIVFVYD